MKAKDEKAVDRRVQKTKKYLTQALIDLILEKGYEKVTIQDIIDRANIGRSTFYTHYESKEQLLFDGHNNLNIPIFSYDSCSDKRTGEITFENLFDHVAQNQRLAKAMLGKNSGNMILEFYRKNLASMILEQYSKYYGKSKAEQQMLRYLSDASSSAVFSLLQSWVEDGMPFTPQNMSFRCQAIMRAIFEKVPLKIVNEQ